MVAADAPVGYSGLRLGADASGLAFRTDKRFNATQPSGSAVTYGLKALRPVWRDQDFVVQATVLLDHKRLTNETAGVAISDNAIDVATFKVAGSTREPWLDGITQFAAAVEYGTLDLSANPQNQAQDQASARTQGRFGKFDFDLTQTEQLTRNTEAAAILSGQLANKKSRQFRAVFPGRPERRARLSDRRGARRRRLAGKLGIPIPSAGRIATRRLLGCRADRPACDSLGGLARRQRPIQHLCARRNWCVGRMAPGRLGLRAGHGRPSARDQSGPQPRRLQLRRVPRTYKSLDAGRIDVLGVDILPARGRRSILTIET